MTDLKKRNTNQSNFGKQVQRRARRKQKAEQQKNHSAWFGLGMFGLIGWSISVPSLIGIFVGLWLDKQWPSGVSWTLTLLIAGVGVGCINAWYWIKQESSDE